MSRSLTVPAAALVAAAAFLSSSNTSAGPDLIKFPENWKSQVLYTVVDRHDTKQYRELYATPEAVAAAKAGKPLPSGTVLTLVQYKAQVDAQGNPTKDANGRFVKGDLIAYTVMEKRTGWGTEYPADIRNGEWEYAAFGADQKFNDKANYKACFQCHKPHESRDFVFSYDAMAGKQMAAAAGAAAVENPVKISGFTFGPGKVTVSTGKSVTWTNADDSPHQIVVTGTPIRSPFLAKGQSHTQTFDAAGTFDYVCGLHPSMKGTVEVTK
jgi:plastocyanin